MRYKAQAIVLAIILVMLPAIHLEVQSSDDSWLLVVDGRPVDVAGLFSQFHAQVTRRCDKVKSIHSEDPLHGDVLRVIRHYSPPDSLSLHIVGISQLENWVITQVKFQHLNDAVVLLNTTSQGLKLVHNGIWSGSTHPHYPEPVIRRYLESRIPGVPKDLIGCFAYRD
ncbi:hypothetical protein [Limnohabitans sp.]|uniref:hypothetical protein n=1 Tax=Limnohabitans sp. TaxID=1907725 RepID=UPI00311F5270